jgi:hypothetical protein
MTTIEGARWTRPSQDAVAAHEDEIRAERIERGDCPDCGATPGGTPSDEYGTKYDGSHYDFCPSYGGANATPKKKAKPTKAVTPAKKKDDAPRPRHVVTIEMLKELRNDLGRKFEPDDVNDDLANFAEAYVQSPSAPSENEFFSSLRERIASGRGLTDGQIKGVLNWAVVQRENGTDGHTDAPTPDAPVAPPTDGPVQPFIPNGTYTVVWGSGDRRTIRLGKGFKDRPETQIASFLSGSDNESDYTGFATVTGQNVAVWKRFRDGDTLITKALEFVLKKPEDAATYGMAYAMESGNCYRCGRTLTVPASIHRGLGPECAKKIGG